MGLIKARSLEDSGVLVSDIDGICVRVISRGPGFLDKLEQLR